MKHILRRFFWSRRVSVDASVGASVGVECRICCEFAKRHCQVKVALKPEALMRPVAFELLRLEVTGTGTSF